MSELVQVQVRESDGELVAFSQRSAAPASEILAWAKEYGLRWVERGDGRSVEIHVQGSHRFLLQPEKPNAL